MTIRVRRHGGPGCRAAGDQQARAGCRGGDSDPHVNSRNRSGLLVNLRVVIHHKDVLDPVARAEGRGLLEDNQRSIRRLVGGPGGHRVDRALGVIDVGQVCDKGYSGAV